METISREWKWLEAGQHLDWKKKKKADVAYSRGKANIIAQHNLRSAYTNFHVDGCLPSHLNIMSS